MFILIHPVEGHEHFWLDQYRVEEFESHLVLKKNFEVDDEFSVVFQPKNGVISILVRSDWISVPMEMTTPILSFLADESASQWSFGSLET